MEIQLRDSMRICVYTLGKKGFAPMPANSASLIAVCLVSVVGSDLKERICMLLREIDVSTRLVT